MTTVAKIRGYINGDDWGVYRQLLSYSQLAALTSADAVDEELNADPTRYYNALNGDSHIGTINGNNYIVDGQGNKTVWSQSGGTLADGNYAFYFGDGIWEAEGQAPSLLTYEEIVAISDNSAILTELNKDPEGYYNSLNDSGNVHMGGEDTDYYIWNGTDDSPTKIDGYRYGYDPSSKIWDKGNGEMAPRE